jgi:hypothetical protein
MAKIISLTRGKEAIVDDEDFEYLSKFKWCYCGGERQNYAIRGISNTTIRMHTEIMKPPKGLVIDHINGNGLDNRKINLRICTISINLQNSKKHKNNASGFRGVIWNKRAKKWQVSLCGEHLGTCENIKEAALIYDTAAVLKYGALAKTNFHY